MSKYRKKSRVRDAQRLRPLDEADAISRPVRRRLLKIEIGEQLPDAFSTSLRSIRATLFAVAPARQQPAGGLRHCAGVIRFVANTINR